MTDREKALAYFRNREAQIPMPGARAMYQEAIKALEQPEVIRCKDCKYGDTFHEFDEPDMPMKCLGQHYGGTYPDDFCSYAERRTDE